MLGPQYFCQSMKCVCIYVLFIYTVYSYRYLYTYKSVVDHTEAKEL